MARQPLLCATVRLLVIAGALLFTAGTWAVLGVITAEALYPGYSTSGNAISDLGASAPPDSIIVQPPAIIFDSTMIAVGLLVVVAAFFVHRHYADLKISVPIGLLGIGVLGVGFFPGNYGTIHALFALIAFVAGGISAIATYWAVKGPFGYISVLLGTVSLLVLASYFAMGASGPFAVLGFGGLERWIAYPLLIWMLGFGGYLMGGSHRGRDRAASR